MRERVCGLVVVSMLTVTGGIAARQAAQPKTLTATVTVTTSNARTGVAVLSKGGGGQPAFLFCDWVGGNGVLRGMDVEPCFEAGGHD